MAYLIVAAECTGCTACEVECPNGAIYEAKRVFAIEPDKCTECSGHFDDPQCLEVCPAPGAVIIDPKVPRYAVSNSEKGEKTCA
jgi:ferredoxin